MFQWACLRLQQGPSHQNALMAMSGGSRVSAQQLSSSFIPRSKPASQFYPSSENNSLVSPTNPGVVPLSLQLCDLLLLLQELLPAQVHLLR